MDETTGRQDGGEMARPTEGLSPSRTPFVGRNDELRKLEETFESGARIVTIVGPPGAGKTRLSREFATGPARATGSDLVFCELSPAQDRTDVASIVADAMSMSLQEGEETSNLLRRIGRTIAELGDPLIILDNVEQIVESVADCVEVWTSEAPDADFLITSREKIGIPGEFCFELGPLEETDAVRLFAERARMVRRDFDIADGHERQISELVNKLDRLPLALELAAARVRTMAPADLLERLNERFRLLRSRDELADRRGQTLEEAIEWSWEFLPEPKQQALHQCSVFRGGFSLDAAESVLEVQTDEWAVDILESLVRKSMLFSEEPDEFPGRIQFGVYESIRDYAQKAGDASLDQVRERHATHYLEKGREWADNLSGGDGARHLSRLRLETSNLRRAFDWLCETDPERAVELGLVLDAMFRLAGPLKIHRDVLDRVVRAAVEAERPQLQARAHLARAKLSVLLGELDEAADDAVTAAGFAEEAEKAVIRARALFTTGDIDRNRGEAGRAREAFEEALAIARDQGADGLQRLCLTHLAGCETNLGDDDAASERLAELEEVPVSDDLREECKVAKRAAYVHFFLSNHEKQRRYNQRALELARDVADRRLEGLALQGLGDSAFARGAYDEAVEHYREALDLHRTLGNAHYEGVLLGNLATALHRTGEFESAERRYDESLKLHRETGAKLYEPTVLVGFGALRFEQGDTASAEELLEEAIGIYGDLEVQSEDAAAARWLLGWSALATGDTRRASERFDRSAEQFDEAGSPDWEMLARASETAVGLFEEQEDAPLDSLVDYRERVDEREVAGIFELVEALALAPTAPDEASARIWKATADQDGGPPLEKRSLYARVASLTVKRLLDRSDSQPVERVPVEGTSDRSAEADIVVGPDARWFQLADAEESGDLRRRGSLRRILSELVDRHGDDPEGLEVYDMFDVGWPDQEIDPDNAADRVYWAVRQLRKVGLEDLLQTTDDGYVLDPDATIAHSKQSTPPDG